MEKIRRILSWNLEDLTDYNYLVNQNQQRPKIENNNKLTSNIEKLNKSNNKSISKAIQQISNKAIYKKIVANQAIQAQQISKLLKHA